MLRGLFYRVYFNQKTHETLTNEVFAHIFSINKTTFRDYFRIFVQIQSKLFTEVKLKRIFYEQKITINLQVKALVKGFAIILILLPPY